MSPVLNRPLLRRPWPLLAGLLASVLTFSGCATGPAPRPAPVPVVAVVPAPAGVGSAPAAVATAKATPSAVNRPNLAALEADIRAIDISQLPPTLVSTPRGATEAPRAPAVIDALDPATPVDFNRPEAKGDLWQRIREGYAMPDLDNALVQSSEQWYASRPDYVRRMTERGSRYLFHIVEEVQRRQLPTELALLPFIESAFNPTALSTAKASGMWQFMPATGRGFDLKQNAFRDDRRSVLASTRAALDYLTRLHQQFGHWHLALAAYNWGEGNVQRAIQRNQRAGLPTDYESLSMPQETRRYVPKLQAVKNLIMDPAAHGLVLSPLENHPYFLTVPIDRDMDVALAAQYAGLSASEFAALNPQLNKPVIFAAGTPEILLPYDNAERFLARLEQHRGNMASWTAWVAHKTLRPAEAAKLLRVDESTLRDLNRIPRGMLIRQGSALLVPRGEHHTEDVSERVADGGAVMLQQEVEPSAKAKGKPSAKPSSKDKAKAASPTKAVAKANAKTPTSTVKGSPAPNTKDRAASAQRR